MQKVILHPNSGGIYPDIHTLKGDHRGTSEFDCHRTVRVFRRVLGAYQPLLGPSARTKLLLVYHRQSHQRRHYLGRHRRITILVRHEGWRITPARHRHRGITLMDSQKRVADGRRLTPGLIPPAPPDPHQIGHFFYKKRRVPAGYALTYTGYPLKILNPLLSISDAPP